MTSSLPPHELPSANPWLVMEIHDRLRDALFNEKYYSAKLVRVRRLNKILDVALALLTSGAIGSWYIWKTPPGSQVWAVLACVAAVLAVIKLFTNGPEDIERYTSLHSGYAGLYFELRQVSKEMKIEKGVPPALHARFREASARYAKLGERDDVSPSPRLIKRCYEEVLREIPAERLWMPAE
ncbi:MAG TPA: hypothetical protein VGR02_05015 [Thermoanaerobaculia bacterium]|nr:hypothetical protein [Thermoanaerobaculia bacterium]